MTDTVLIEVATSFPEWMFSLGHFAVLAGLVLIVFIAAAVLYNPKEDGIREVAGFIIGFSFVAAVVWIVLSLFLYGGDKIVPSDEAERVAAEVSEVTGVPVTAEQVKDMEEGDYVPGVNYDRLTDSDGDLVFKVEVG